MTTLAIPRCYSTIRLGQLTSLMRHRCWLRNLCFRGRARWTICWSWTTGPHSRIFCAMAHHHHCRRTMQTTNTRPPWEVAEELTRDCGRSLKWRTRTLVLCWISSQPFPACLPLNSIEIIIYNVNTYNMLINVGLIEEWLVKHGLDGEEDSEHIDSNL